MEGENATGVRQSSMLGFYGERVCRRRNQPCSLWEAQQAQLLSYQCIYSIYIYMYVYIYYKYYLLLIGFGILVIFPDCVIVIVRLVPPGPTGCPAGSFGIAARAAAREPQPAKAS